MLLQLAFVLLCCAQLIHLSKHWLVLNSRLRADANAARYRHAINWKSDRPKRGDPKETLFQRLFDGF